MTWWLKARRWQLLLLALGAYFVLLVVTRDRQIVLPSLGLGTISLVLAMWYPLLPTVCLAMCLESRVTSAEASGIRRIDRLDLAMSIATVLAALLLGIAARTVTGDTTALSAGRNTAFLVGLTLTVRSVVGPRAVLAAVLWPVTVSLIGFHGAAQPYHWTVLPERPSAWYAAVGAALAFAVGVCAQYVTSRKRP